MANIKGRIVRNFLRIEFPPQNTKDESLIFEINAIANFWRYVNVGIEPEEEVNSTLTHLLF